MSETTASSATAAHSPEARLAELGIVLPEAPKPVASYVPFARSGNLLYISGQIPMREGKPAYRGIVGGEGGVSVEEAIAAARLCTINALAVVRSAVGTLGAVKRVVRVGVFVAAGTEFEQHPKVANGASDLLVEVFGEAGRHARAAVGCPSLPLGVPVEVELLVEVA